VTDPNWNKIFKQNLRGDKGDPYFDFNLKDLSSNMKKLRADVATWSPHYGLWPGQAWVRFAAYSRWVHLSTNTLPFQHVMPRLQGKFNTQDFNLFGDDQSNANHWMHQSKKEEELWHLSNSMKRWLQMKDGCDVLLMNKTEAGSVFIPERGVDYNHGTP
jgi:hypothetical protein